MAKRPGRKRILNMVTAQKSQAESFLNEFRELDRVPNMFSGVVPVKFGGLIMVWQYHRNKLVGTITIRQENIPVLIQKLTESTSSWDFLNVPAEVKEEETDVDTGE